MVASGLPVRNKDKHVLEIALLSLDVMTIVSEAKVPHLPDERWSIRIGINTGKNVKLFCVCLRIVVSNTYCVVFLFCFSSSFVIYVASFSGLLICDCPFGIL